jgi:hypothetical protein
LRIRKFQGVQSLVYIKLSSSLRKFQGVQSLVYINAPVFKGTVLSLKSGKCDLLKYWSDLLLAEQTIAHKNVWTYKTSHRTAHAEEYAAKRTAAAQAHAAAADSGDEETYAMVAAKKPAASGGGDSNTRGKGAHSGKGSSSVGDAERGNYRCPLCNDTGHFRPRQCLKARRCAVTGCVWFYLKSAHTCPKAEERHPHKETNYAAMAAEITKQVSLEVAKEVKKAIARLDADSDN